MAKYSRPTREQAYHRSNGASTEGLRTSQTREKLLESDGRSRNVTATNTSIGDGNSKSHQEQRTRTPNESLPRKATGLGGFVYLIMSNAGAGFDGLDEATSRATATASAEPRIESASSTPPLVVLQSRTRSVPCNLSVSLYRSTIWADETEERSHRTKVLAKSDGENREERGAGESTAMAEGSRA